jgi:hypothetical protein
MRASGDLLKAVLDAPQIDSVVQWYLIKPFSKAEAAARRCRAIATAPDA